MRPRQAILLAGLLLVLLLAPVLLLGRTYSGSSTIAIPTVPSVVEERVRGLEGWARWGLLVDRVDGAPRLSAAGDEAHWPGPEGAAAASVRISSLDAEEGGVVLAYELDGGDAFEGHRGTITITELEDANTSVRWEARGEVGPMPWSRIGGLLRGGMLGVDVKGCVGRLRGEFVGSGG